MRGKITDLLQSSAVLHGVPRPLLEKLSEIATQVNLIAGQNLFYEGDEGDGFYMVLDGSLKATRLSPEGIEQLIAVFKIGDVIGEMAIFDDSRRSATISALKPSSMVHWRKRSFFDFADANPEIYRHMLGMLAGRLRATNDALAARHFLPLAGQLAQAMLRLGDGFGEDMTDGSRRIAHRLTQAELAAMIGASRENVSRVLNQWRRDGILDRVGGFYHIVDAEALHELSDS